MANYESCVRTNYFRVKDEDKFLTLMDRVYGGEDTVDVWSRTDDNEQKFFAFGCYDGISGIPDNEYDSTLDEDAEYDDDDENVSYEKFIEELQQCVADDDAIIITEVGNEKLRYLVGSALIITATAIKCCRLDATAKAIARDMLGNPDAEIRMEY